MTMFVILSRIHKHVKIILKHIFTFMDILRQRSNLHNTYIKLRHVLKHNLATL